MEDTKLPSTTTISSSSSWSFKISRVAIRVVYILFQINTLLCNTLVSVLLVSLEANTTRHWILGALLGILLTLLYTQLGCKLTRGGLGNLSPLCKIFNPMHLHVQTDFCNRDVQKPHILYLKIPPPKKKKLSVRSTPCSFQSTCTLNTTQAQFLLMQYTICLLYITFACNTC